MNTLPRATPYTFSQTHNREICMRVLLVEDDEALSEAVCGYLRAKAFVVDAVPSLAQAGAALRAAQYAAVLLDLYAALDIEDLARELEMPVLEVGRVYHGVSELLEIDRLLTAASRLPRESHWETMARGALRDDLYLVLEELTRGVLAGRSAGADGADGADELVSAWARENEESVERVRSSVHEVLSVESGLAPLSVILRSLRSLARTVTAEA